MRIKLISKFTTNIEIIFTLQMIIKVFRVITFLIITF